MEENKKENLEEKAEVSESKLTENSVGFQIATSIEWIEGLMQRIHQSLVSNTPLIMCEKDLDALDFLVLAASCAEPKAIVERISEIKKETGENEPPLPRKG